MTDTRKEIAAKVGNVAAKLIERRAHLHAGFGIVECLDYATDEVNKSSPERDIPSEIAFTRDLFFEDAKAQGLSEREAGIRWGECPNLFAVSMRKRQKIHGQKAQKSEWIERIRDEVLIAHWAGWYIFMDTLTCDPWEYNKVFAKGSKCWQNYRFEWGLAVGFAMGIKSDKERRKNMFERHRVFCITEPGGKNGRLHMHVLHFCKAMPYGTIDPNSHLKHPIKRVIGSLEHLWPHGRSWPVAIRYGHSDAFTQAGWKYPVEDLTYAPYEAGNCIKLAHYMSKYFTKNTEAICTHQNQNTINNLMPETRNFRVKATRGLDRGGSAT